MTNLIQYRNLISSRTANYVAFGTTQFNFQFQFCSAKKVRVPRKQRYQPYRPHILSLSALHRNKPLFPVPTRKNHL